jgi:hypothetical protein
MGRWGLWGWEFACYTDDASLALLCNTAEPVKRFSEPTLDWSEAIALIDKYPWHKLHPIHVHPEFGKRVFESYRSRTLVSDRTDSKADNWKILCNEQ